MDYNFQITLMTGNSRRSSFEFRCHTVPPVDSEPAGQPCSLEFCLFKILNISKSGFAGTQTEHLGLSEQGYYFPRKLLEEAIQCGSNQERE